MNIGSNVYMVLHGILRFGTITKKLKGPDGWAHFSVKWTEDDQYKKNVEPFLKREKHLYRADELFLVDAHRLSRVVTAFGEML